MKRRDFFKVGMAASVFPLVGNIGRVYAGDEVEYNYPVTDYFDDLG